MATKEKLGGLPLEKLLAMAEPITIHVERVYSGQREDINVPGLDAKGRLDPNAGAGHGWTIEAITKLTWWIRDFWTGGGTYEATAVDSRQQAISWEFLIPVKDYETRKPQPLNQAIANVTPPSAAQPSAQQPVGPAQTAMAQAQAAMSQAQTAMAQVPQQQAVQLGGVSQGQPTFNPWEQQRQVGLAMPVAQQGGQVIPFPQQQQLQPAQTQATQYQPQTYQYPQGFGVQVYPQQQYPSWSSPYQAPVSPVVPDKDVQDRIKALEALLNEEKLAKVKLEYEQRLDKVNQESQRQIDSLKEEVRRGNEKKSSNEDDRVRQLEKEIAAQKESSLQSAIDAKMNSLADALAKLADGKMGSRDDDRIHRLEEESRRRDEEHKRELDKRDAETREHALKQELREQAARTEQQLREIKDAASRGPDPMLEYMKDSQRNQTEVFREISASNKAVYERFASSMPSMADMMRMMAEKSSGTDQFMGNMLRSVSGVVDMYKGAIEHISGISGGGAGSWVPDMVNNAVGGITTAVKTGLEGKRDEEVSANKAKIAQAQAQAQEAIARTQIEMARLRGGGLAGVTMPEIAAPPQQTAGGTAQTQADGTPSATSNVIPLRKMNEQQAFGPAYQAVLDLRKGALKYLEANGGVVAEDARKSGANEKGVVQPIGISPSDAVNGVINGATQLETAGVRPPAFKLYSENNWADFVDMLMPGGNDEYKSAMVAIFVDEVEDDETAKPAQTDPDLQV